MIGELTDWLNWQACKFWGSACLSRLPGLLLQMDATVPGFFVGPGIQIQVLMLVWQALKKSPY